MGLQGADQQGVDPGRRPAHRPRDRRTRRRRSCSGRASRPKRRKAPAGSSGSASSPPAAAAASRAVWCWRHSNHSGPAGSGKRANSATDPTNRSGATSPAAIAHRTAAPRLQPRDRPPGGGKRQAVVDADQGPGEARLVLGRGQVGRQVLRPDLGPSQRPTQIRDRQVDVAVHDGHRRPPAPLLLPKTAAKSPDRVLKLAAHASSRS